MWKSVAHVVLGIFLGLLSPEVFAGTPHVKTKVSACNYAPYPIQVELAHIPSSGLSQRIMTRQLESGLCDHLGVHFVGQERRISIRGFATDSPQLRVLQRDGSFQEFWSFEAPEWRGPGPRGEVQHASDYTLVILDPHICGQLRRMDCFSTDLGSVSRWAYTLSTALKQRAWFYSYADDVEGLIPTMTGFTIWDDDEPYDLGVRVSGRMRRTPLGTPIAAREGDRLRFFNGQPIFSHEDIVRPIMEHAREQGYAKPYAALVEREEHQHLEITGALYFDATVYGPVFQTRTGDCRFKGEASVIAALQEASFSTASFFSCLGPGLPNGVSARRCRFTRQQLVAAFQQFCPHQTESAAFAGAWFVPVRGAVERTIAGLVAGTGIKRHLLRVAISEGLEEGIRAAINLPPGVEVASNIDAIRDGAVFGAGMGVAMDVAVAVVRRR